MKKGSREDEFSKCDRIETENEKLKKINEQANKEILELRKQNANQAETINLLRASEDEIHENEKYLQKENTRLKFTIMTIENEILDLNKKISELTDTNTFLKIESANKTAMIKGLDDTIKDLSERISELLVENELLKIQIKELEEKEKEEMINKADIPKFMSEDRLIYEIQFVRLKNEKEKLKANLLEKENYILYLNSMIESFRKEAYADDDTKKNKLELDLHNLSVNNNSLKRINERKDDEIKELIAEKKALLDKIEELQKKVIEQGDNALSRYLKKLKELTIEYTDDMCEENY